jgi:hypothetical protein
MSQPPYPPPAPQGRPYYPPSSPQRGPQPPHGQQQYPPAPRHGHASAGETSRQYAGPPAPPRQEPARQQQPPAPQPPAAQEPPRRRKKWPFIVGAIVALFVIIGIANGGGSQPGTTPAGAPTVAALPSAAVPAAPAESGTDTITYEVTGDSVSKANNITYVKDSPPAGPARELTSREWALIAKSPDSHVGEHVIVFGYVSQFDSVTGPSSFRASLDGVRHRQTYEYDTNAILVGRSTDQLANVVVNDQFRAEVTITGSLSYSTTMGGTLTVPQMQVEKIEVIS